MRTKLFVLFLLVLVFPVYSQTKRDICWEGTLNGKIPVFIHYQFYDEVIVGEITYLNSKAKQPIKLIGTLQDWDKQYRLLEFDKTGNITGVIVGLPDNKSFKGIWFSPKTKKELNLILSQKDTVIFSQKLQPDLSELYGNYEYQYADDGYQGNFSLKKLRDGKASFSIFSRLFMQLCL